MTEKEQGEMIVKASEVQICVESIDMHNEWICHISEELEKLKRGWMNDSKRVFKAAKILR